MRQRIGPQFRAAKAGPISIAWIALLWAAQAQAATCTWNNPDGAWIVAGNWIDCADQPGPSTRSPGPDDIAVIVNGIVNLGSNPTVAELELGAGGRIHTPGSTRVLTVTEALRLNGGRTTTVLGLTQLHLVLAAGASGNLLASTSLEDATFLMNSGSLALGSASGASLSLKNYAELQNLSGGTITLAGGDSRLYLEVGASVANQIGASIAISGNTQIGKPAPANSTHQVNNFGSMSMSGPGTLSFSAVAVAQSSSGNSASSPSRMPRCVAIWSCRPAAGAMPMAATARPSLGWSTVRLMQEVLPSASP